MRSEVVYWAGTKIVNRFLLSTVVMKAVHKLHINSKRTEDTVNNVLQDVAQGRYTDVSMPPLTPPPAIEPLVVDAFAISAA